MPLPNASQSVVPRRKIVRYLLNPDHPDGGAKARLFQQCGFSLRRPEQLRRALLDAAEVGSVVETVPGRHGIKYIVDAEIETPEGGRLELRSIWIILTGRTRPRFVTAYPAPGREA